MAVPHCEQSEFNCCSQGWMTQVSNFFWCRLPAMICLWCWRSLQMHCGNRQGLILASEFYCGIPDIFSILGGGVSLEVEKWTIYLAQHLLQLELCLRSCIRSPGPHRFCSFAFLTLQNFLTVSCACVWSLCSLPACVSIFRLRVAIAGQHCRVFLL